METVLGQVEGEGALVEILVGLSWADVAFLRQLGKPVPAPVSFQALIDTGAEQTCLDSAALAPLVVMGLQPSKFLVANMPAMGGLTSAIQYDVGLSLVHPSQDPRRNLVRRSLPILEQSLGPFGYEALLGRDILAHCMLAYDGPSARFTLGY